MIKCPKCKQKTFQMSGSSMKISYYKCKCGYKSERTPTKKEIESFKSMFKTTPRTNIHRVYHDFQHKFFAKIEKKPVIIGKKKMKIFDLKWKWTGYDLMAKVEKWATKYKDDVTIVRCDDDSHAGSILALIQHRKQHDGMYMGTTAVFIPQCTGEDPTRFFLYPGHHDNLIKALKDIKSRNIKKWNEM